MNLSDSRPGRTKVICSLRTLRCRTRTVLPDPSITLSARAVPNHPGEPDGRSAAADAGVRWNGAPRAGAGDVRPGNAGGAGAGARDAARPGADRTRRAGDRRAARVGDARAPGDGRTRAAHGHPGASGAGAMADIHDIKAIIPPKAFPMMVAWIAAAALLLFALLLGRHLWRKRRGTAEIPTLTPELPPEENARLALNTLARQRLVDGRRFYFRLSEILRRYIFERYGIGAPEMTPEELQPLVARLDLPAGQLGALKAFWSRSEPVKFAGRTALESDMADDLGQVRRFVAVSTEAVQLAEAAATAAQDGTGGPPPPQLPPPLVRRES